MKKTMIALALICGMACFAVDPATMTGADLVAGNAKKESGYSQAQLQAIAKALKGRELTFENGKIDSVSKDEDDGSVTWFEGNFEGYHEQRRRLLGDAADQPKRIRFRPI